MGDFNLEPEQEGIELILKSLKDAKEVTKIDFGPSGTFNGYNFEKPVTRRIDYIFVNDKVEVKKYAVLSDSKDLKYPSDHLPVLVLVKFEE
jgi:endonuclease/exonuclease/phosphatase family metal-dependent hydrolase